MYIGVIRHKGVFMVILMMGEVARTPLCVKDSVSYETGEWKYLELF